MSTSEELGPLPPASAFSLTRSVYTAEDMHYYALQERTAERERCASLSRGAIYAALEAGSADAMRIICELHQRLTDPNVAINLPP